MLFDKLAHPVLMSGIDNRPQQADGYRLDLFLTEFSEDLDHPALVQRTHLGGIGEDAPRHLVGQRARQIGLRIRDGEVERLHATTLAPDENVAVPLGRQERGLRGIAGHDRIDRVGRAVDEEVAFREEGIDLEPEILGGQLQAVQNAIDRIVRGGRGLVHVEAVLVVLHDQVGERPARIHSKPH